MCGISGILNSKGFELQEIKFMTDIIHYRGPDDEGYVIFIDLKISPICLGGQCTPNEVYLSDYPYKAKNSIEKTEHKKAYIALGHRRLSILDLSPAGHQPMSYANGRYWIVFNGEIYNYIEIRQELIMIGYEFISNSDTEVILAAYAEWGVDCQNHFNGMWAFTIYDSEKEEIFMSRDRFGIKPFYYWFSPDNLFAFGSEIKQFTTLKGWEAKLNKQRAYDCLVYSQADHTDETLFNGVWQLKPGHYVFLTNTQLPKLNKGTFKTVKWYNLPEKTSKINYKEAKQLFKSKFFNSIKLMLRSDVTVGSCLSGGLDSSAIVCSVSQLRQSEKTINKLQCTFSACSEYTEIDERKWVEKVIEITAVNAFYTYPTKTEMVDLLSQITWHQDEPYHSNSILMQWKVFELASKNKVTVMLDGQGADELLAGYHSFFFVMFVELFHNFKWLRLAKEIYIAKNRFGYSINSAIIPILHSFVPDFLQKPARNFFRSYETKPNWLNMTVFKTMPEHPHESVKTCKYDIKGISNREITATNLQKLLHWEDRNSMAHSIESRVPFLDHEFVEFCYNLPSEYKIKDGNTKRIMRDSMVGILPDAIRLRQDKMGFISPEEFWVRNNPEIYRKLLNEAVENSNGLINTNIVTSYENMLLRKRPFDYTFWRVISFSVWIKVYNVSI